MRLIDADAFEKFIKEKYKDGESTDDIKDQILFDLSYQPTAYDPEAVAAELEEYKYSHLVERDSERCEHCKEEEKNCDGNDCFLCVWDKAIEIVRNGGAT